MLSTFRRIAVSALGFAAATALLANPALAKDDDDGDDKGGSSSSSSSSSSNNNSTATSGQSTFVSPDKSIAFGFTVPSVQNDDIWFTLRVPIGVAWGAVGLGSDKMAGALVLMIYMNEKGDNVTFSPRTSHGDYEPKYYPGFKYEVLPGTGLFDDHMVFTAHCKEGCQNWDGGWLDVSKDNEKAIYATGPGEGFASNDPAASVCYHASYGSFQIDMKRTFGNADAPVVDENSTNVGTTLLEDEGGGKWDKKSLFHGIVMIFVFIGMMPFGIVVLRVGNWVKWHALNQFVAMIIAFGGAGLGIATSLLYQRSRGFNQAHQIVGLVAVGLLLVQFVLGFLHHRAYKKTQQTTKMAPIHVWLGRIIIVMATVDAFLGFPLALKPHRNYILAAVVVLIFGVITFLLVGRGIVDRILGRRHGRKAPEGTRGYDPEPWRHADTNASSGYGAYGGNREYSPGPPQHIGLMDVSSRTGSRNEMRPDLGTEQRPKEFA